VPWPWQQMEFCSSPQEPLLWWIEQWTMSKGSVHSHSAHWMYLFANTFSNGQSVRFTKDSRIYSCELLTARVLEFFRNQHSSRVMVVVTRSHCIRLIVGSCSRKFFSGAYRATPLLPILHMTDPQIKVKNSIWFCVLLHNNH
jgi:hypothetical protein